MGLDMYLSKKIYVGGNYEHRNVKGKIELTVGEENTPIKVDLKKLTCMEEEVGYWRKANAIHNWFVNQVQKGNDDCKSYYVDPAHLEELYNICKEVVNVAKLQDGKVNNGWIYENGERKEILEDGKLITNTVKVQELLPTTSGFFFGSTEYDQYYMDVIHNTIKILEDIFADPDWKNYEYCYQASW